SPARPKDAGSSPRQREKPATRTRGPDPRLTEDYPLADRSPKVGNRSRHGVRATRGLPSPGATPGVRRVALELARFGPTTPTPARRLIDASVDPTEVRNAQASANFELRGIRATRKDRVETRRQFPASTRSQCLRSATTTRRHLPDDRARSKRSRFITLVQAAT